MPNPIVGLFLTGEALAANCSKFTPNDTQINAYLQTDVGKTALTRCAACNAGMGLIGYIDASGKYYYQYTCSANAGTQTASHIIETMQASVAGCSGLNLEYNDCVQKPISGSDYCDNDFYWDDNGNCAQCPPPPSYLTVIEDGGYPDSLIDVSLSGGTCGWGTRESDSYGIESCIIAADSLCSYCDSTGCFSLKADCPYVP